MAYSQVRLPDAVASAFVRREVGRRLCSAAASLPNRFGIALFDAWRPLTLQKYLFREATHEKRAAYVAPPTRDPTLPPPHLTGGAVDITLTWDNEPLSLGTAFDDLTEDAHADSFEGPDRPDLVRQLRRLLYWTVREEGFIVNEREWWHFEFGTSRWAQLTERQPRYAATAPAMEQSC